MTMQFKDYLAGLPVASAPAGAGDKTMILQGGVVKMIDPRFTAVLLDSGGSGKRFQVTITYIGLADDGVTPILALNGVQV